MKIVKVVRCETTPEANPLRTVKASPVSDAEAYRLYQAEQLMREAGFVPSADGTWHPCETRIGPTP